MKLQLLLFFKDSFCRWCERFLMRRRAHKTKWRTRAAESSFLWSSRSSGTLSGCTSHHSTCIFTDRLWPVSHLPDTTLPTAVVGVVPRFKFHLCNIELTQPRPVKPHAGCAPPPRESHPRLSHQIPDLCFARVKALVPPPTVMIPLLTGSLACPSTTLFSHSGHCWVASSRTASRRIIQTQVSLQEYQLGE